MQMRALLTQPRVAYLWIKLERRYPMNEFKTFDIDVNQIERDAHALRAQATADAVRAFRGWLSEHLHFGKQNPIG